MLALFRGKVRAKLKDFCNRKMANYENKITKYKAALFGNMETCHNIYNYEDFASSIPMKFEDDVFTAPIGYDNILNVDYGDYMKLPPVEEQGVKLDHIVKIDTERSYTDYKGVLYCKKISK